ncbi:MAG: hypothetical protein EOP84_12380, partial [Verrucomicrobiaceae bacterium]
RAPLPQHPPPASHLMHANTSKSNALLSNSAKVCCGAFCFSGSFLAAAWGATLISSAPAWGRIILASSAPA